MSTGPANPMDEIFKKHKDSPAFRLGYAEQALRHARQELAEMRAERDALRAAAKEARRLINDSMDENGRSTSLELADAQLANCVHPNNSHPAEGEKHGR